MPKSNRVSGSPNQARAKDAAMGKRRFSLLVAVVLGTVTILVVAILLTPLPPTDELPPLSEASTRTDAIASAVVPSSTPPNLVLPKPGEAWSTEQAQGKLTSVAVELSTRFPSDPNAHHVAGMIYAELKQTKKGEAAWRKCLELKPSDVGPYVGLATLLIDRGEETEGIELLEGVRGSGKATGELLRTLAHGLTQQGELERADGVVKEGIRTFPNDPSLWLELGLVETQLRQFSAAESSIRKAVDLGDRSTPTLNALNTVLTRQGKMDEVKRLQEELEARSGKGDAGNPESFQEKYSEAFQRVASPLFQLASGVAKANNKIDVAEEWLLQAVAIAPEDPSIYMELSALFRQTNRIPNALVVHQRLLEVQPDNLYNYTNLASIATQLGRWDLAEKALIEAVAKFPTVAFPSGELARLALAQRNFPVARQWSEKAWGIEPQNVEWHLMGAIASKELGNVDDMTVSLLRAREIAPSDPRVRDFMQGSKSK